MAQITDTQTLITRLTTLESAAIRRFPHSAESVQVRVDQLRTMVGIGATLADLRTRAIEMKAYPFIGSLAGMKWLDTAWDKLIMAFPVPVDEAELAAHLTNDLMEANR